MFNEKALIRLEEIFKFLSGWNSWYCSKLMMKLHKTQPTQFLDCIRYCFLLHENELANRVIPPSVKAHPKHD